VSLALRFSQSARLSGCDGTTHRTHGAGVTGGLEVACACANATRQARVRHRQHSATVRSLHLPGEHVMRSG
jgi:hypothetical protein